MTMIKHFPIFRSTAMSAAALALLFPAAQAGELLLKKGDRLAIVGDSITEQQQYSRFIEVYNDNLGRLSAIAGELAEERGFVFANMHPLMMDVMAKAKAANGEAYQPPSSSRTTLSPSHSRSSTAASARSSNTRRA